MKQIDKLFRDKLSNHEVNVPEHLWNKIEPHVSKEVKRGLFWYWISGIAFLLIAGYLLLSNNKNEISPVTTTTTTLVSADILVDDDAIIELSDNIITTETNSGQAKKNSSPNITSQNSKLSKITSRSEEMKMGQGKPANLKITKTYIENDKSVISQMSSNNELNYNVVLINTEGKVNAKTLMRIIEPVQEIVLPAFNKNLKKKI